MIGLNNAGAQGPHPHRSRSRPRLQLSASIFPAVGVWAIDRGGCRVRSPWDSDRGASRGQAVSGQVRDPSEGQGESVLRGEKPEPGRGRQGSSGRSMGVPTSLAANPWARPLGVVPVNN